MITANNVLSRTGGLVCKCHSIYTGEKCVVKYHVLSSYFMNG